MHETNTQQYMFLVYGVVQHILLCVRLVYGVVQHILFCVRLVYGVVQHILLCVRLVYGVVQHILLCVRNVVVETNISQCCLMFSLIVCVNFIVVKRFFIEKIVLKR
jgi:hypothetical protein